MALLCGNVLQAFDFSLQAFVKGGFGAVEIFEAFIYYLHYKPTSGGGDTEQDVKRQLLERLIACWQDQKFSFVQLENLFIQVSHLYESIIKGLVFIEEISCQAVSFT